ncbi:MAG: hypothetical protein J6B34_02420 [Clostridia bacterium]|nr:hypothetical protein [Clostridia bacterium]
MRTILKKLLPMVLAVLLAIGGTGLVSCTDNSTTKGGSATGSSDITVSDPEFGFIREEEYDPATSVIDTSKKWTTLDVDTSYYLFLSFDITSARDNDGQSLLDLNITFDALNVMDGTIEDVSTGDISSLVFTDAVTGNIGKTTTASFKIPALSSEPKKIEMIVKLRPVDVGESHIIIGYNYDAGSEYKILGSDGYTKNLQINEVQIETPVLSVEEPGILIWNNVKNAEYYMLYENGQPVKDFKGDDIVISSEGYMVGGQIRYSLVGQLFGFHNIEVRACSSNKNIKPSSYSNVISFSWN